MGGSREKSRDSNAKGDARECKGWGDKKGKTSTINGELASRLSPSQLSQL